MKNALIPAAAMAMICVLLEPVARAQEETAESPEVAGPAEQSIVVSPLPAGNWELEAFVDGLVAAHLEADDLPGAIVAIVQGDQTIVKAYGLADASTLRPVESDTMFRIGSISKTFVWTAIMMLVEEGKIDLDADVNLYLKNLQIPPVFDEPITLNDLMAHRSGLEEPFGLFLEGQSGRTLTETLKFRMPERVDPPGEYSTYSNWGAALAAKIVEDVAGMEYQKFLFGRILEPLGMDGTTMLDPVWSEADGVQVRGGDGQVDPVLSARLALPHRKVAGLFEPQPYLPVGPCAPAGAMSASAGDMAKWMRVHLSGGGALLRPETHALMLTRAFSDGARTSGWAHGFRNETVHGVNIYRHTGSTQNFLSSMTIVPSLDFGMFISANGGSYQTVVPISNATIKHLAEKAGEPQALRDPAAEISDQDREFASKAAGSYLANRRSSTGFEKLLALPRITKVSALKDGTLLLTPAFGAPSRLYPVGEGYYETIAGDSVYFHVNEEGEVVRLGGTETADKVTLLNGPKGFNLALYLAGFLALTILLGTWWRVGREARNTGMGRKIAVLDFLAALIVIGFIVALFLTTKQIGSMTIIQLQSVSSWPPPVIVALRAFGLAAAAAAVLATIALLPAWRSSGWSTWRKLHHTLFAAALLLFTWQMWMWNVIGAATAQ